MMDTKITTLFETEHEGYYTTEDGRIFLVTDDEIKQVQFIGEGK